MPRRCSEQAAGPQSAREPGSRTPADPGSRTSPAALPAAGAGAPAPPTTRPAARTRMRTTRGLTRRAWVRERRAPPEEEACVDGPPARRPWTRKGVRRVFSAPRVPRACGPGRGPPADVHVCSARSLAAEERLLRSVPRLRDAFPPGAERRPVARPCPQPAWRSWFCRSRHPHPPHADRVTTGGAPRRPRSAPERLALRGSWGALRGAGRTGAEVPFFCSGSFRIKGRQLGL